jgi:nucleoside-diphosphate-sugar epimerase
MSGIGTGRRAVVTGVAGFIGSTLARQLLDDGWSLVGVDALTPYYDIASKRRNLERLSGPPRFEFHELDLATAALDPLLDGADVVFHLAGQPGVRLSWAEGFDTYLTHNVLVTQRILESQRRRGAGRVVYASSSSVYGNVEEVPTPESAPTRPYSPYGVTKLAGEQLCDSYRENFGVESVVLRYFTVYGPRQRPDMALHRMIEATIDGAPFMLFGDGAQIRDFTYVGDIVDATIRAGIAPGAAGSTFNVAGGGATTMNELIEIVGAAVGAPVVLDRREAQHGDVRATGGDISRTAPALGWHPQTSLRDGVAAQVTWHRSLRR